MGRTASWAGIYPASLTMFTESGDLDDEAMGRQLDRLIAEGAHGVVVGGTSGEFIGLTDAERRHLIDVGVAAVNGRIPLIAGTGHFSTAETIRLTDYAAAAGADGAIVILPYYQGPTEAEVLAHFRAVGRAVDLPIMVYNNPANSGAPPLTAEALGSLYGDGLAAGVKSTFPTVHQVHEARAATDDGFRVFYGSFMAPLEGMAGGAHGWISGILNVVVPDAVALWNAMNASDLPAAREAWARILPIRRLYTDRPLGPIGDLALYRAILRLRGETAGFCRKPLQELNPDQVDRLRGMLPVPQLARRRT
jgi:4-hydroxy-tetrahydrodipicolinate synthase